MYTSDSLGPDTTADQGRPTVREWLSDLTNRVLPNRVRAWAIGVYIAAPAEVAPDQPMEFTVVFRNRLPIPIQLETRLRPWYWHIDGVHDADESELDPDAHELEQSGTFSFDAFESKEISRTWNGRVRSEEDGPFLPLDRGEHELGVELTATNTGRQRAVHRFQVV